MALLKCTISIWSRTYTAPISTPTLHLYWHLHFTYTGPISQPTLALHCSRVGGAGSMTGPTLCEVRQVQVQRPPRLYTSFDTTEKCAIGCPENWAFSDVFSTWPNKGQDKFFCLSRDRPHLQIWFSSRLNPAKSAWTYPLMISFLDATL